MTTPPNRRQTWHAAVESDRSPEEHAQARTNRRIVVVGAIVLAVTLLVWIGVVLIGFMG